MKIKLACALSFLLFIFSCSKETDDHLPGTNSDLSGEKTEDGIAEDVIGLSGRSARFTVIQDTVRIHAEGLSWRFVSVRVDGTDYKITPENDKSQLESHTFSQAYDWLTINRKGHDIVLAALPNGTEKQRTFELSLQDGEYFDSIQGTQDAMMIGEWENDINISQTFIEFDWRGGTATIDPPKDGWRFNAIEVGGVEVVLGKEETGQIEEEKEFFKKFDWLTVRATSKKINLIVDANHGKARSFHIYMRTGDNLDQIEGKQGAAATAD